MSDNVYIVLDRFRSAATTFIQTVDSVAAMERDAFLVHLSHRLVELYKSALDLPAAKPETLGTDETPVAKEKSAELFHLLREKIGSLDGYWEVFDSREKTAPVQGTLAGDISEIYFDLKQDLQLEGAGVSQADLLWELHFSFRSHWGKHLLSALTAIHDLHIE
jgi:hypothetical protein